MDDLVILAIGDQKPCSIIAIALHAHARGDAQDVARTVDPRSDSCDTISQKIGGLGDLIAAAVNMQPDAETRRISDAG